MPTRSVRKRVRKRKRVSEKSRAELLAEIAGLPPNAFVPTAHAAAYLGSTPDVMGNWRSQRRGPRYYGSHEFIRYRLADLDRFMATRADEIPEIENAEEITRDSTAA
jgi:hypothetical protein